jgi:hypothetical protein
MGFFLQRRFSNSTSSSSGFRGMDISSDSPGAMSSPRRWKQTAAYWWRRTDVANRGFVRSHSDLAMSHVATYYKSYQRAANDVIALIESSGVEPIIHDDITTHMCSALCSVVSGCIVVLFGMLLTTHRNTTTSTKNAAGTCPCSRYCYSLTSCATLFSSLHWSLYEPQSRQCTFALQNIH